MQDMNNGQEHDGQEHDGQGHDGQEHDGQEHDGQEHDGQGHDGQEHDGEEHDGQELDGEELDGEEHDGEEHDGQEHDGQGHDGQGHDGQELDGEEHDGEELDGEELDGEEHDGEEHDGGGENEEDDDEDEDEDNLPLRTQQNRFHGAERQLAAEQEEAAQIQLQRMQQNLNLLRQRGDNEQLQQLQAQYGQLQQLNQRRSQEQLNVFHQRETAGLIEDIGAGLNDDRIEELRNGLQDQHQRNMQQLRAIERQYQEQYQQLDHAILLQQLGPQGQPQPQQVDELGFAGQGANPPGINLANIANNFPQDQFANQPVYGQGGVVTQVKVHSLADNRIQADIYPASAVIKYPPGANPQALNKLIEGTLRTMIQQGRPGETIQIKPATVDSYRFYAGLLNNFPGVGRVPFVLAPNTPEIVVNEHQQRRAQAAQGFHQAQQGRQQPGPVDQPEPRPRPVDQPDPLGGGAPRPGPVPGPV